MENTQEMMQDTRIAPSIAFEYNETEGNLFDYEKNYALAHCIGADCRFDEGLSKYFQARYSTRDELRQRFAHGLKWEGHGYCVVTNNSNVFNLVTKRDSFGKSTLVTIEEALKDMMEICNSRRIKKIAMPRIGCGYDGLHWMDVHDVVFDTCNQLDFEVRVVYFHEYLDGKVLDPDVEKMNFGKDRKAIDGNTSYKYY